MKKLYVLIIGLLFSPSCVFAMTIVDDVQVDTTWDIQGSPYLLNDPFIIYPGANLIIDPGVVVKVRQGGVFIVRGGNLTVNGTSANPVYVTSELDDSVGGDTNQDGTLTAPSIGDWVGIEIESGSQVDITNSSIKYTGGPQHINPTIKNYGVLNLNNSILSYGGVGIQNTAGTSTLQSLNINNHDTAISVDGGSLSIHNSNINSIFSGIDNFSQDSVDATNNWWGDASGPFHPTTNSGGLGASVSDNVLFIPWLGSPYNSSATTTCCSSVLFLPGFMASDLYVQGPVFENQLWPPTSLLQQDVDKLKLDSQGNPVTPGIYTKSIVEEAFGVNFYKSFADKMRSFVQAQVLGEWLPFPYDWRKDLSEIVNNFTLVKVGNNFENKKLIDEAVALAQRSPTGKITIIGHSNGGLVGKYLIRELVNQGKGNLVDQFIMVATPQLGTPKAIASLLHGDGQSILMKLVLNNRSVRLLGMNMQSAHNLFPVSTYFQNSTSSVIDFNPSIRNVFDYSLYNIPQTISSYDDLISFVTLLDRGNMSGDPTDVPITLRADLLNNADLNVKNLAQWVIPDAIKSHQLIGVGQQTISGIEYQSKEEMACVTRNGLYGCVKEYFWNRFLMSSFDGDGTVLSHSAQFLNGISNVYFFDLFNANKNLLVGGWRHDNILEHPSVSQLLEDIILLKEDNFLPPYISQTKPNMPNSYQQISVHSPVSLSVLDANGNLVGRDITRQGGDFVFIREDIPNSRYIEIGDQKYINLPVGAPYTINLQGEGSGTFTLNIDQHEDAVTTHKSFVDIPVTVLMKGQLDIDQDNTVGSIAIDTEGDGVVDITFSSQNIFDARMYLATLKTLVKNFDLKKSQKRKVIKELDSIEESIERAKTERVLLKIKRYIKFLNDLLKNEKERGGFGVDEIQLLIMYLEKLKINL